MAAHRPAFDIVHLVQSTFPEDPRPRREAAIAAGTGARVAVIAMAGADRPGVSRYGRITVIRLAGRRRRGWIGSYLAEYFDFLLRARGLIARTPRLRNARIVHVHTLPDFLVAAAAPARRRGARVILDLHEVFPEFTRSKFGRAGAALEPVARLLERWSRRRADQLITVNDAVADRLRSRPARRAEPLVVVHNFSDPAEFGPGGLTSGVVTPPLRLVYHGTLTPLYGLELALEALARARAAGTDATFDLFGAGPSLAALRRQAAAAGLEGAVRFHGSVSHHVLREVLPTYHAGLLTTRLDCMTRLSLSTKLLEYVHLGIPLIAPAIPTYQAYFPDDAVWYFEPGSAARAAEAIARFAAARPGERIARARAAQAAAARRLDPERDAGRLREVYERLLALPPR